MLWEGTNDIIDYHHWINCVSDFSAWNNEMLQFYTKDAFNIKVKITLVKNGQIFFVIYGYKLKTNLDEHYKILFSNGDIPKTNMREQNKKNCFHMEISQKLTGKSKI